MKIATVIHFCSNEARFIGPCIEQARKFSEKIYIPVCDHFFDGKNENLDLLQQVYAKYRKCTFIQFPWLEKKYLKKYVESIGTHGLYHTLSRVIGFTYVPEEIDWVLFLDTDEIVDGDKFSAWLNEKKYHEYDALKLANYWYFKDPCLQAEHFEDSILFLKRGVFEIKNLLVRGEREGFYDAVKGPKKRNVLGLDSLPMIHHYSWVRSKKEILRKVQSWGHKHERDWETLIEQEFSKPDLKKDFIHGYSLKKVDPFIEEKASFYLSEKQNPSIVLDKETFLKKLPKPKGFFSKILQKFRGKKALKETSLEADNSSKITHR